MKTIRRFTTVLLIAAITFMSCSKNSDDEADQDDHPLSGTSHIRGSVTGNAVNQQFEISKPEDDDGTVATIAANFFNVQTDGSTERAIYLRYTYYESGFPPMDFTIVMPAQTGAYALGEVMTTNFQVPVYPTYYLTILFDDEVVFYDNNNDNVNDAGTRVYSKTNGVVITELEEATNSIGLIVPSRIKGTISGIGFMSAFTGPNSEPEKLTHTVTATFEYYADL